MGKTMNKKYDLVIVGAGTAAMTAAMRVRASGRQVAVIDFRPFGGTCALRGCDPKKMLVGGTEAFNHARRMREKGVAGEVHIEWLTLMAFKRTFTDPVPQKMEKRYEDKGIDTYHGRARFVGKNAIKVATEVLEFTHCLIASGAEPVKLNIPGEEHLIDNEVIYTANPDKMNRGAIGRFLTATERAAADIAADPEKTWASFSSYAPELSDDLNKKAWKDTYAHFAAHPAALDKTRYAEFGAYMQKQGLIKTAPDVASIAQDVTVK